MRNVSKSIQLMLEILKAAFLAMHFFNDLLLVVVNVIKCKFAIYNDVIKIYSKCDQASDF